MLLCNNYRIMAKKVFITGISGFAGGHLARYFCENTNFNVSGTYLEAKLDNLKSIKDNVELHQIDLTDRDGVTRLLQQVKPDHVYHLAALASPADSFRNPVQTITNNVAVQVNLLEAVRTLEEPVRVLIVSSADVYGAVLERDLPINEETRFAPTNPYAVSKITQDFLGLQYFLSYKLAIIRVRPFNHIGPGQSPHFVVASFAKKIAEIEAGKRKPILEVGNLHAKRDFTDVRDIVKGYGLVMEKGIPGEVYNMGSGVSYEISDILDKLLSFSKIKIKVVIDESLIRPIDTPDLVCDSRKFREATGWMPMLTLDITLRDTLDYWRELV